MRNIEKYKDVLLNAETNDLTCCVIDLFHNGKCPDNCKVCKQKAIEWLLSEYKEPVLDDAEKAYLSALIKPFREKVQCIEKRYEAKEYFIKITVLSNHSIEYICLPYFNLNSGMYKGMIPFRKYNLKELGL